MYKICEVVCTITLESGNHCYYIRVYFFFSVELKHKWDESGAK